MSEVTFAVKDPRVEPYAAVPTIKFTLVAGQADGPPVHTVALRCQVQIETRRRRHSAAEQARLVELFGEPPRWAETLKPLLWTHVDMMVPGFEQATEVDLSIPCTYDLEVAPSRYFQALEQGEVSILFQFSGTIFRSAPRGFSVERVGWHQEARCLMPVSYWHEVMERYFPGTGWIRLHQDTIARLLQYKRRYGISTFDELFAAVLQEVPA